MAVSVCNREVALLQIACNVGRGMVWILLSLILNLCFFIDGFEL